MRNLLAILFAIVFALSFGLGSASADTLHGFCNGCVSNGSYLVTLDTTPNPFGFSKSGGSVSNSGSYWVEFLVPNLSGNNALAFQLNSTFNASLVNPSAWTTGNLGDYLGGSFAGASPTNPIGAYLPPTQGIASGATGFFVYQFNLGNQTLSPTGPSLNVNNPLPFGSWILGFFQGTNNQGQLTMVGTPNSSAIFVPEPASLLLLGAGLAGIGLWGRRNQK